MPLTCKAIALERLFGFFNVVSVNAAAESRAYGGSASSPDTGAVRKRGSLKSPIYTGGRAA
jgi:hypothetical protein